MNRLIAFLLIAFQFGAMMMANDEIKNQELWAEGVSRELARWRAANISDVKYSLHFDIARGATRIAGQGKIRLKLKHAKDPVILDFRDLDEQGRPTEGWVGNVAVNHRAVKDFRQMGGHIVLPARHFKSGENLITIGFYTYAAAANRPIIRYQDHDDGSEYFYTLFVPLDASLAFPCFDQPDLKARFTLSVLAHKTSAVISNTDVEWSGVPGSGSHALTKFKETKPISTYLFAFAVGPFNRIEGEAGGRRLRVFVRQSKLQRATEEWPEVERLTRQGMEHMTEFFDQPFPFGKYDQV